MGQHLSFYTYDFLLVIVFLFWIFAVIYSEINNQLYWNSVEQ